MKKNVKFLKSICNSINENRKETFFIVGIPEREILQFEQSYGKKIPGSYFEFLQIMGKESDFLKGTHYRMNDLALIQKSAVELINVFNEEMSLKENDFAFWADTSVSFAFFKIGEGDNPPIYGFVQGQLSKEFVEISPSLSDFLNDIYNKINPLNKIEINKDLFPEFFGGSSV